jgi:hypothetical protein
MEENDEVQIGIQVSPEGEPYVNRSDLIACLQKFINCDPLDGVERSSAVTNVLMDFVHQLTMFGRPQVDCVSIGALNLGEPVAGEKLRYYYSPDDGVFFHIADLCNFIDCQQRHVTKLKHDNDEWKLGFNLLREILHRFGSEGFGSEGFGSEEFGSEGGEDEYPTSDNDS